MLIALWPADNMAKLLLYIRCAALLAGFAMSASRRGDADGHWEMAARSSRANREGTHYPSAPNRARGSCGHFTNSEREYASLIERARMLVREV